MRSMLARGSARNRAILLSRMVNVSRYSPMGSHGLTGPDRAHFPCCVVTYREHEIKLRSIGLRELIPALAVQTLSRNMGCSKPLKCFRPDLSRWMAASAIGCEPRFPSEVKNGFSHDGTRRVTGT